MPRLFGGLATRAPRSQPGCRSGGLRALQATAGRLAFKPGLRQDGPESRGLRVLKI